MQFNFTKISSTYHITNENLVRQTKLQLCMLSHINL